MRNGVKHVHRFVQHAVLATILLQCNWIAAQDAATNQWLTRLKTGSAQDVESAISLLPNGTLEQSEIARQLTLLLNDERAVVEHIMGRETVSDSARSKMLDLPSTAAESILHAVPTLESDRARGRAFEVISRIGKPNGRAYELILPYVGNDDVYLRSRAISALSAVADNSELTVLQFGKLLLDSDPMVKWTVLDALDERCECIASVIPEVIELLENDSDVYIAISNHFAQPKKLRGRAARLLAKIGPKASDALAKLKKLTAPEYDKDVRIWSATAICKISNAPSKEALDLLGQLLLDDMEDEFTQNDAPEAIALLGPFARPLLDSLELAKNHKSVQIRWGLVNAFFAIDPDSAVSRCLPLMDDEKKGVVEIVIEAFSKRGISEPPVIAAYVRALRDYDGSSDHPAHSAVDALAKLGKAAKASIPALEELVKNLEITDTLKEDVVSALSRIQ